MQHSAQDINSGRGKVQMSEINSWTDCGQYVKHGEIVQWWFSVHNNQYTAITMF